MGRNLLDESKAQIGFGVNAFITPEIIGEVFEKKSIDQLPWESQTSEMDMQHLKQHYQDIHGIGWWRIMKGAHY